MATYNKFNIYVDNLHKAKIDWSAHTFKVMLTNSAPSASNSIKSDITDISAGNGYSAGGTATTITLSTASGTEKALASNVTFTASGGAIGPARYFVIYDDTQSSPVKPLICWFDYGSAFTLNDTDSITLTFDGTNGLFQMS